MKPSEWVRVDKYHAVRGNCIVAAFFTLRGWVFVATKARKRIGVFDSAEAAKSHA